MPKVIKIEFVDHGIEHASYFQGCGVAFTKFDTCFTGVGTNAITAIEDCLEQATISGYDIDRELEQEALDMVKFDNSEVTDDNEDSECYYHVSVRLKVED